MLDQDNGGNGKLYFKFKRHHGEDEQNRQSENQDHKPMLFVAPTECQRDNL